MKLYRFAHSCYARKVQILLELLGRPHSVVDVPYADRNELAVLTGGYIQVPVLVDDDDTVVVDSRAICEYLLGETGSALVPSPWEGPIWAYADWCDGPLEDVCFRLASPGCRSQFTQPFERALYTLVKERKFGRGCVDEWERTADTLAAGAQTLLAPTVRTLQQRPFIFGDRPTLADAALYGQCAMLRLVEPGMPEALAPELGPWMARVEAARK